MEEISCAECGDPLGLWFPAGKYQRQIYCSDCYESEDATPCEEEKDELEQRVDELEADVDRLETELERSEAELQEAEIREADLEQQIEDPIEN